MQYTAPHYYGKFKCIAGRCPDTCCAGWQIAIDKKSLKKYKKQKGILGNRLHNEIDRKQGIFRQYEGRCAFLNEENLCDLYLEGGSGLFCKTCRTYPRHIEEFEGLKEISLSLSCPVAAGLILGCEEPVRFLKKETDAAEAEEYEDFDYFLFTKLEDARDVMIRILQNREISIDVRMLMVLALSHDLQRRIQSGALFEVDSLFERYEGAYAARWFAEKAEGYAADPRKKEKQEKKCKEAFTIFDGLEVLRDDWDGYLKQVKASLFETRQSLSEEGTKQFDIQWEQLIVYFVYTYFCGAVYDGDAYSKMKFALLGTLLIREITKGLWVQRKRDPEDREARFNDLTEAARRYAKEIEHSELNKSMVEERLKKEGKFGIEAFFWMLG